MKTDQEEGINYYPALLNLRGRNCVVVGGGRVAERKIRTLLTSGADVTVVSPRITAGLRRLVSSERIVHKPRRYRKGDLRGAFLVIAATSDEGVNRRVYEDSEALINSVDMPEYCNFIVPSVVSKGPLKIAISSSGLSPSIARTLREELEDYIPDDLSAFLTGLESLRRKIKRRLPGVSGAPAEKRSRLLKKIGSKDVLDILKTRGLDAAREHVDKLVKKELR